MDENVKENPVDIEIRDPSKRNFLKAMSVVAVAAAVGGVGRGLVQNIIPKDVGITGFPSLTLVNSASGQPVSTSDIKVNDPSVVLFEYPLQGEPNFLLRMGDSSNRDVEVKSVNVSVPSSGKKFQSPGGVGPYKSVVAASAICEHLGCVPPMIHFYKPGSSIPGTSYSGASNKGFVHCNCHGSTYDPLNGFGILSGPTQKPLPNIVLNYDSTSDTYKAVSMVGPTIYGQTDDLKGNSPLSSDTQTQVSNSGTPK
ncbi:MAG TPA: Rieske 2Fe-2S domain-containing protein [Thermoplasmataceae archaeon]|nr:Rieske 2Fe-2S domain-containing protein [Thermoplasmataceae archaeon]